MTRQQATPYQILKNDLFSLLNEDKDSLFYLLAQKKINKSKNLKNSIISILNTVNCETSLYDIVARLIASNDIDMLTDLILGEKASSSKKAILCGYDCCLHCKKDTSCQRILSSLKQSEKINYLMYLRFVRAKKTLKMLRWSHSVTRFNILLKEPLLMKFLTNYALVVDIKNELKKEGVIAPHPTLYKGAGKYCPFQDLWEGSVTLHPISSASPNKGPLPNSEYFTFSKKPPL